MFSMKSSSLKSQSLSVDIDKKSVTSLIDKSDSVIVPEIDVKLYPSKVWNPDSRLQVSTKQWIRKFGLKAKSLDSSSLFPKLGFARLESYNKFLKKPIHSKYSDNLFPQHFREDGQTFNVVAKKEKLLQTQKEIEDVIELYKERLEWLSSESRRLFGVIEERVFTVIVDIKNTTKREFDQFICAIERLINEQIRYCVKFNLIRAQDHIYQLGKNLVSVTKDNIGTAIDWLWAIDREKPTGPTNLIEALIRAASLKENEAIYLITEGNSSDGSRDVLREKVKQLKVPLNIVAYNCKDQDFLNYLECLTAITGGRFHTYSFNLEIDAYESSPLDLENPKANILLKKKVYGGSVGGIGTRNDCVAVFSEIEEAKVIMNQIKSLIDQIPDKKGLYDDTDTVKQVDHISKEEYLSSMEWLIRFGIKPRKLDFYDVLSGVCFRHCDGVIDVLEPPLDNVDLMEQQDATKYQKLINAKYCDKFAHVKWKDGSLVHVQIPSDVHRLYTERMNLCLQAISRRIEWLRQGSRELFGTITEDKVYILIDTSSSMEPHIGFVKEKLYVLIQEQLRHKQQLNFVAFNSKALPWRDRLVEVSEPNLKSAWHFLEGLHCQGSTNTLAALQFAIKDRNCQGIYLLTDGRPDQPTRTILSQIRLNQKLPIHTISFNCADLEANKFLCELAKETGGRFHYFNEISGGSDCTDEKGLEAWESEDIKLLKAEYRLGFDSLERITKLRDECHKLAWKKEIDIKHTQKNDRKTMIPGCIQSINRARKSPSRLQSDNKDVKASKRVKARNTFKSHQNIMDPNTYHSFLEALSSRNGNEQEWVVDETQDILDRQADRFKKIVQDEYQDAMSKEDVEYHKPGKIKSKNLPLKQWLNIYGLVPQHMTILDALAPTVIKVKPKYIPIINRQVISKVFEEIFPISHIVTEGSPSKGYKPVVRLVNPLAIDLKGYQDRLENLLKKYKKKLRQLIIDNIGEEAVLEFDDILLGAPLGNDDVKRWILKTFENANWPICEDELEMFLKEIYIGHKYFIQAGELIRIRKGSSDRITKNDIAEMEVSLPISAKSKQSSTSNELNNKFKTVKNQKNLKK